MQSYHDKFFEAMRAADQAADDGLAAIRAEEDAGRISTKEAARRRVELLERYLAESARRRTEMLGGS